MKEYRLPKGWTGFFTNASFMNTESPADKRKREQISNNMLRNCKKKDAHELLEFNEKAYELATKMKASYEQAKKDGKLLNPKQKAALKEEKKAARKAKRASA